MTMRNANAAIILRLLSAEIVANKTVFISSQLNLEKGRPIFPQSAPPSDECRAVLELMTYSDIQSMVKASSYWEPAAVSATLPLKIRDTLFCTRLIGSWMKPPSRVQYWCKREDVIEQIARQPYIVSEPEIVLRLSMPCLTLFKISAIVVSQPRPHHLNPCHHQGKKKEKKKKGGAKTRPQIANLPTPLASALCMVMKWKTWPSGFEPRWKAKMARPRI